MPDDDEFELTALELVCGPDGDTAGRKAVLGADAVDRCGEVALLVAVGDPDGNVAGPELSFTVFVAGEGGCVEDLGDEGGQGGDCAWIKDGRE